MGIKYEGDEVFDPAMRALLDDAQVQGETVRKVASALVKSLLDMHWNTPENSLAAFEDNPHVVAAFKEHGILLKCTSEHDFKPWQCEEERGHFPAVLHKDYWGNTWTDEEAAK